MSDEPGDKVRKLPVRFKNQDPSKFLQVVSRYGFPGEGCTHRKGPFIVCDKEAEVECGSCGTKLSPLWVLQHLATMETPWHHHTRQYQDEMKRLKARSRTKCQHCGKMTKISRAKPPGDAP